MSRRPARILVVDDYRDAVEMWGLYLRSCGYEVETREDGLGALELTLDGWPDLVVLDIELPGMSGLDVARRIRGAAAETARIPLIAATGHSGAERDQLARDAGFDIILIKPCDPPTLVEAIERLLSSSRPLEHPANG